MSLLEINSQDIKKGIVHAANVENYGHIKKLSNLLHQYGFTKNEMRNIFSDTMVKDGLTNSIKTILQKNDINSLQEITKILSEFNLDFKVTLAYILCDDLIDMLKETLKNVPSQVNKIISSCKSTGLTKGYEVDIFYKLLCDVFINSDKDLLSRINEDKNLNQLFNELNYSHYDSFLGMNLAKEWKMFKIHRDMV